MLDRGDAINLETCGNQDETVKKPDVSLENRKIGEPDVNPGGASSLMADTPKRGESEQESSAESKNLNEILCDTPSVDLSQDRIAQSGKFPEDEFEKWSRTSVKKHVEF